jgi:hypothetical protein
VIVPVQQRTRVGDAAAAEDGSTEGDARAERRHRALLRDRRRRVALRGVASRAGVSGAGRARAAACDRVTALTGRACHARAGSAVGPEDVARPLGTGEQGEGRAEGEGPGERKHVASA